MIALDSSVLIYAMMPTRAEGTEALWQKANHLLHEIREQAIEVGIPTPVISEVLCIKAEREIEKRRKLIQQFVPLGFNLPEALLAAELQRKLARRFGQQIDKAERPLVKHDAQILAICHLQGVTTLYTTNLKHFAPMAVGLNVKVLGLPEPANPLLPMKELDGFD